MTGRLVGLALAAGVLLAARAAVSLRLSRPVLRWAVLAGSLDRERLRVIQLVGLGLAAAALLLTAA